MSSGANSATRDAGTEDSPSSRRSYLLPYSDVEIQRLDVQQQTMSELYEGRMVLAPVHLKEGSEVLDVATGSGAWAFDFAKRYPAANTTNITCIDVTASMFLKARPPNMTFQVTSALAMPSAWTNKFALVHQRLMLSGIKYDEWVQDIQEIYRVTKPGGWAQLCETNRDVRAAEAEHQPGPAQSKVLKLVMCVAEENGMDFLCTKRIPGLMEAAGFVDVHREERVVPLGAWNGDLSRISAENLATVLRAYRNAVSMTGEEYDTLMDELEREWAAGPGGYDSYVIFVGRKPE